MRHFILVTVATIALGFASPLAAATSKPDFTAAVAQKNRAEESVKLDESRKPAEVLAFLGLAKGMTAADIMTGSGYWAEIIANALGADLVTAFEPNQFYTAPDEQAKWKGLVARRPDIAFVRYPFESFAAAPNSFDFSIINLSYHDLYWQSEQYKIPRTDPAAFLKALHSATKSGGIVGVIDHVGLPGDTRAIVDAVHRIDPAIVKADFAAAGFVLEAESALLANPADDRNKLVFDPAVRGKTDRFMFRFRKPK